MVGICWVTDDDDDDDYNDDGDDDDKNLAPTPTRSSPTENSKGSLSSSLLAWSFCPFWFKIVIFEQVHHKFQFLS